MPYVHVFQDKSSQYLISCNCFFQKAPSRFPSTHILMKRVLLYTCNLFTICSFAAIITLWKVHLAGKQTTDLWTGKGPLSLLSDGCLGEEKRFRYVKEVKLHGVEELLLIGQWKYAVHFHWNEWRSCAYSLAYQTFHKISPRLLPAKQIATNKQKRWADPISSVFVGW